MLLEDIEAFVTTQQLRRTRCFLLDCHNGHDLLLRLTVVNGVGLKLTLVNAQFAKYLSKHFIRHVLLVLHDLNRNFFIPLIVSLLQSLPAPCNGFSSFLCRFFASLTL